MSAEICRRPGALLTFLKNKRLEQASGHQITVWESSGRNGRNIDFNGEPMSPGRGDAIEGHMIIKSTSTDNVVYAIGIEKPTLGEVLFDCGVTPEAVDPHALLDFAKHHQEERLSEALRREREGTLTRRWGGYLRDVRAYMAIDHRFAFDQEK